MQYANTALQVQQVNTPFDSIELGSFSAISQQSQSDTRTHYTTETADTITLNCYGLEPINSHGICLLIQLLIYTKRQQKRLQVFGLSKHNQYIFEITRLNKFINIIETENQAVATIHLI